MKTQIRIVASLLAIAVVVGCGKGGDGGPAPERPFTGAPVAFEVVGVNPDGLDVKVYNFSDKPIAQYSIYMKYFDASGKAIIVRPGGAFEKDYDFWSMSGRNFKVEPKSWASFKLDHLEVPKGAVKAEVIARSVTAIGPDGNKFEEDPLWELEGMDWPTPPAGAPTTAPEGAPAQ